jgi:hypothetical protein
MQASKERNYWTYSLSMPQGSTASYTLQSQSQQFNIFITNITISYHNAGGTTEDTFLTIGGTDNYYQFVIHKEAPGTISVNFAENPLLCQPNATASLSVAIGVSDFVFVNVSGFYVLK